MAEKRTPKNKKRRRLELRPSHTKGYYRFSADFPSVTDSEGYRDNDLIVNSPAKKASVRRRLILLFVCVFVVTFFTASVGFTLSKLPVSNSQEGVTGEDDVLTVGGMKAVCLSGEVLSYSSAESMIGLLKVYGVNTVVIDFKDAAGNFYFEPSIAVSADALSKVSSDPKKIINEFRAADIEVFAKLSCFADDIYARNNKDEAAYVLTENAESGETERNIWYDDSAQSHAWLNPYSNEVQYYIRVTAEDIQALGVDGIIFDNVILPDTGENEVNFDGAGENSPSEEMASLITLLNSVYVSCETAATVPGDVMLDAINNNAVPSVFLSGCDYVIPDARLSLFPDNTVIYNRRYAVVAVSPAEFITDFVGGAVKLAKGDEYSVEIWPMIEATDTSGKQIDAIAASEADSYIMFSSGYAYSAANFE